MRRAKNKKLPKLQESDTDDCFAIANYVTVNCSYFIFL